MGKEYRTGIVITGDAKGGVRAVKLTEAELKNLSNTQKKGQAVQKKSRKEVEKTSRSMKEYAGKLGLVTTAAAALTTVIGGIGISSMVNDTVALTRETNVWANAVNVSTQELQASEYATQSLGLSQGKIADIYKDTAEKIADAYLNGGGEAVEVLEHLNLTAADLVNMSPDKQLLAIAGGLGAIDSNASQIQILESLASDASLLIPLLKNDAQQFKQLKQEAIASGVAMSAMDVSQIALLDESLRKASAESTGFTNQITVALAPALIEVVDGVGGVTRSLTELVTMDTSGFDTTINGLVTLSKIVAGGGVLYAGLTALPIIIAALPVGLAAITAAGVAMIPVLQFGVVASLAALISPLKVGAAMAHVFAGGMVDSAAATMANVKAFGILNTTLTGAFALWAGWEFGTWLYEDFVQARIAGLTFISVMINGWERMKFAGLVMWESIKAVGTGAFNVLREMMSDYLSWAADGLSFVGADEAAANMQAMADGVKPVESAYDQYKKRLAELNSEMKGNINLNNTIIQGMVNVELQNDRAAKSIDKVAGSQKKKNKLDKDAGVIVKKLTNDQQSLLDSIFPAEKAFDDYADSLNQLLKIKTSLLWSEEQYQAAVDALTESYLGLDDVTNDVAVSTDFIAQIYKDTATSVRGAWSGAFRDLLDGTNSLADRMKNVLKDMLADMATMAASKPLIIPMVMSAGNAVGAPLDAQEAVIKQLGGGSLADQKAWAADNPMLASAGATLGAGFMGYMAGGVAADMFNVANPKMAQNLTGMGAMIGSSIASVGGPMGAAIGFAIGGMFKGDWKTNASGLELSVRDGQAAGRTYQEQSRKGGWFSSSSNRTVYGMMDRELQAQLQDTFGFITDGFVDMGETLGRDAEAILSNFTSTSRVSLQGLSNDDAKQAIEQWVKDIAGEMALDILPMLDGFMQAGEGAADALVRVTNALVGIQDLSGSIEDQVYILSSGNTALANYTVALNNSGQSIRNILNSISESRDPTEWLNLEQQLYDQVMNRYRLEQEMIGKMLDSVRVVITNINGLRTGISNDVNSITGTVNYRNPASITDDLNSIIPGGAPVLNYQTSPGFDSAVSGILDNITSQNALVSQLETQFAEMKKDWGWLTTQDGRLTDEENFEQGVNFWVDQKLAEAGLSLDEKINRLNARGYADYYTDVYEGYRGVLNKESQVDAANTTLSGYNTSYGDLISQQDAEQQAAADALIAYNAALDDYVSLTGDQVTQLQRLRDETLRYYQAQKQLDEVMRGAAGTVGDTLDRLRLAQLSPAAAMDDRLANFRGLASSASGLSGYDLAGVSGQLNSLVDPLLSDAKTLFASGQGYQDIYNEIVNSLGDIQSRLLSEAPVDYQQESLGLLNSIDGLLGTLEGELSVAEQAIVSAIDLSRIQTVGALEDIRGLLGGQERTIVDGSHANGLYSVPFDGYMATLHEKEAVIDAGTMSGLRKYGVPINDNRSGGKSSKVLLPVLQKIQSAIESVGGDLNLQVVTPDGKVLKEAVFSDLLRRSEKREIVIHANGIKA